MRRTKSKTTPNAGPRAAAILKDVVASRFVWAVLWLSLVYFGGRAAQRSLASDVRFFAFPDEVTGEVPAWGGPEVLAPVSKRLRALGPVNLFDERFEETVRAAVEEVPGVARVVTVWRHWPRRYSVDFVLHRPYAVVEQGGHRWPVTHDLTVLPHEPYAVVAKRLFVVIGVPRRPPEAGRVWRDRSLAAGLATLAQLAPHLDALAPLGLGRIDVSGALDARRGVVLLGADGIRVRWGRSTTSVRENPVETKIDFLTLAADDLDRVRGHEIDVRYGRLYLRELPEQP